MSARSNDLEQLTDDDFHEHLALLDRYVEHIAAIREWESLALLEGGLVREYRFKGVANNAASIRNALARYNLHTHDVYATRFGDSGIVITVTERGQVPMSGKIKGK